MKMTQSECSYWKNRLELDAEHLVVDELAKTLFNPVDKGFTNVDVASAINTVIDSGPRKKLIYKQERALVMLLNCFKTVCKSKRDANYRMLRLLDCAVTDENLMLVKLLLSYGAKPKESTMEAASEYSSSLKNVLEILAVLLEAGGKIQHAVFRDEFECLNSLNKTKMAKMAPHEVIKHIEACLLAQEMEKS